MARFPVEIRLPDHLAVVTGAAQGIGAATAVALALAGADLWLCDRDPQGLARTASEVAAAGRHAHTSVLDVRDRAAVGEWIGAVEQSIDVVVNNAGGGFPAAFADVSPKGEDALIAENFTSATAVIRAALPHMAEGASIVNITTIEAHRAAPGFAIYAAMKAALANLTRSLALELAPRRIRVNAVAPDVIPTPGLGMLEEAVAAKAERGEAMQPWPDAGTADDVAAAVVWLASPLARFVTGTTVHVDGGTWAAGGWRRQSADDTYTL